MNNLKSLLYILVKSSKKMFCEDNTVENFWGEIREILANSNKPFLASTAAMLCKYVAYKIEREDDTEQLDDEDIEIWSQENIEWTLLIGKLEDVTLLNILTMKKPVLNENCSLPKLNRDKIDVSLKYVLQRKGSVSELVARWLTQSGIDPEYIVINDRINELHAEENSQPRDADVQTESSFPEEKIRFVQSEGVFQHLNMIRTQWPYSLEAGMILANMSWEYALEWKTDIRNLTCLEACISCLKEIPNFHLRLGLFNLVWKTHLKLLFENATKLLNKVGKVPKERLCIQDTGLTDLQLPMFITICTEFLDTFSDIVQEMYNVPKKQLNFEPLWENGGQPLAELAVQQTNINYELLLVHYQLSLVFQMLCTFSIKSIKPINNLFDSEVISVLFKDFQEKPEIDYSRTDSKLNAARVQFLTKVISLSVEAITVKDDEIYATDHVFWMSKCRLLGMIWDLDIDSLRKHQVVQLFTHGYNIMAYDLSGSVSDRNQLGIELLALAGKRMSKHVAASSNLGTQLAALTPTVTRYMDTLNGDWCAESTLKDIIDLTTLSISCLEDDQPEYKLAMLLLEACSTLRDMDG
ncbi:hypothetical protein HHI36_008981 [Cryptolaemus montrouzieri]|uniref:Rab3GAP regulatory subunit C-terminal domain-containing protein n=1 Tax=Cryptolaemus montrouzieri TaxID=559131 RepID=A0ABD2MU39_9CUCU